MLCPYCRYPFVSEPAPPEPAKRAYEYTLRCRSCEAVLLVSVSVAKVPGISAERLAEIKNVVRGDKGAK